MFPFSIFIRPLPFIKIVIFISYLQQERCKNCISGHLNLNVFCWTENWPLGIDIIYQIFNVNQWDVTKKILQYCTDNNPLLYTWNKYVLDVKQYIIDVCNHNRIQNLRYNRHYYFFNNFQNQNSSKMRWDN